MVMLKREMTAAQAEAVTAPSDALAGEGQAAGVFEGVILRTEGPQPLALLLDQPTEAPGAEARCYVPRPLPGAEPGETPLVVGDRVLLRHRTDDVWEVMRRLPRRSALKRGDPARPGLQTIVANVDQIVIVVALHQPEPSRHRLDRLLVLAEQGEIPATVCLNKIDLAADPAEIEAFLADYRAAGYGTLATSVARGLGLDDLRERLRGQTTAFVGESGVGKSSLLNAIYPGANLRVGELSAVGRGAHTTTAARLVPTPDGYIVDTPGVQFLIPADLEPEDVGKLFPEIRRLAPDCRFPNCAHRKEAGCAVLAAVEADGLSRARWQSYVGLREEVEQARQRRRGLAYRPRGGPRGRGRR